MAGVFTLKAFQFVMNWHCLQATYCVPTQDVKKAGFQLASFNSLHWLCSLIWRSLQSWYEPNSHRSEKREPSGSVMANVTNQPRRNLGTFMDNSLNRSCNQYLLPQPLFWSMVQKKTLVEDRFGLLYILQVTGHKSQMHYSHIPSPHFHHFTPYWFPPWVSLYSPGI